MVIILSMLFRKTLVSKIRQVRVLKKGDKSLSILFDAETNVQALPESGSGIVNDEKIISTFSTIDWFEKDEIRSHIETVRNNLFKNGIVTEKQIENLVTSEKIRTDLATLYIKYLDRPVEQPFDPVGFSLYGPLLLKYKNRAEVLRQITISLIFSDEFKAKQKEKKIALGPILGEVSVDYFLVKCTDCDEIVECEYLGYDPAIPYFRYKCKSCGKTGTYKMGSNWKNLPVEI